MSGGVCFCDRGSHFSSSYLNFKILRLFYDPISYIPVTAEKKPLITPAGPLLITAPTKHAAAQRPIRREAPPIRLMVILLAEEEAFAFALVAVLVLLVAVVMVFLSIYSFWS